MIKTNGQALDVTSLAYRIEEAIVPSDDGGTASVGRITWLGESETTVRDLLQRSPQGDDDRNERDEAVDWLLSYLRQHGDSPSKDIFKAARAEQISERTLKRARPKAGVEYERIGFPSVTYWRLGQSGHSGPGTASVAQLGTTAGLPLTCTNRPRQESSRPVGPPPRCLAQLSDPWPNCMPSAPITRTTRGPPTASASAASPTSGTACPACRPTWRPSDQPWSASSPPSGVA